MFEKAKLRKLIKDNIKVDPLTGCWVWQKATQSGGYGRVSNQTTKIAKTALTHRISYFAFKGDIEDMLVCHTCDNPPCCNPDHLFLGTPADNTADMVSKGRQAKGPQLLGETNGMSILTEQDVKQIEKELRKGRELKSTAKKFKISESVVSNINQGINWTHVTSGSYPIKPSSRKPKTFLSNKEIANIKWILQHENKYGIASKLAKQYNVSTMVISNIKKGKHKNIEPLPPIDLDI